MTLSLSTPILLASLIVGVTTHEAQRPDVTIAAGNLSRNSSELFRIDDLWIRVAEDTEFHRWLSRGIDEEVAIILTANTEGLGDEAGARILTGKLIHETAPAVTPNTVDQVGQLPSGNLPMVHIVFLIDEVTGTLGAVTLQTADAVIASKFEGFDDARVSIVIRIKQD